MLKPKPLRLTVREEEILRLLSIEKTEPEIARFLGRGPRTINQHVRRMMKRNGIETRLGLIRRYEAVGIELIDGRK